MSGDIEDLVRRIVDQMLSRQAHMRVGVVTSYDPNRHAIKAKQQPEGHETGWMPIGTPHVGNGIGIVAGATPGDQVILGYHEGDIESPVVLGRIHSDQARPPAVKSGEVVVQTSGSMIKMDQAGNLTQTSNGATSQSSGGAMTMSSQQSMTMSASNGMTQTAGGNMGLSAGGNMSMSAAGSIGFSGSGQFAYNGLNIAKGQFIDGSGNTMLDGIDLALGGTATAPIVDLYRAATTTGLISAITNTTKNAAGTPKVFTSIEAWNDVGTAGGEYAHIGFKTMFAGVYKTRWSMGAGLLSQGASGGDMGADTINTIGYYINGISIFVSPAFTGTPTAPTQTAGDNSTKLATTAYVDAASPKVYVSAQQAITSGGALTLAHGLGVVPGLITATIVCQTAELGYSVGDPLFVGASPLSLGTGSAGFGITVVADATNLNIRYGSSSSVFITNHKTSGNSVYLNNPNWKLVVRASA